MHNSDRTSNATRSSLLFESKIRSFPSQMIDLDPFFVSFITDHMTRAILKIFFVFLLRWRGMEEREVRRQKSGDCGGAVRGSLHAGKRKCVSVSSLFSSAFSFLILFRSFSYVPPQFPFLHTAPSQSKNKENFQNRSYDLIIDERNKKRI